MINSKINQLRQSTFKDLNYNRSNGSLKQRLGSAVSLALDSQPQHIQIVNRKELHDYLIRLPVCSYHHQPIKFLCLSPVCNSSNYGLCQSPDCRMLHSDPDADLIELDTFNQLIAKNCASLLLVKEKVHKYLKDIKNKISHKMDVQIQKSEYIIKNLYMGEVPKLIRDKNYRQLTSNKLYDYVKKQTAQNNEKQRLKMENFRNQIVARANQFQKNINMLFQGKQFQKLILSDIIKPPSQNSFDLMGKIQINDFQSKIIEFREQFQFISKILKENRAPQFSKIRTIFRASQHQFSAFKYHESVDGKSPTITIIKNALGKKFGAFLNCKTHQKQEWIADTTGLSFIFSLDREQVFKLKSEAGSRLKAAFGGLQGPQIGSGCDIYVLDKCDQIKGSGANLGGSYKLPFNHSFNQQKTRRYLGGQQLFLVTEYQVFILE